MNPTPSSGESLPSASAARTASALLTVGRAPAFRAGTGSITRAMDEKRIQWAADDLIKNRPALSRWHADFKDEFAAYMGG